MSFILVILIAMLLATWLFSLVVQFRREVMTVRRRGKAAIEKELRLKQMIDAMETEEKALEQRIENQLHTNDTLEKTLTNTQVEAANRQAAGRNRLLLLGSRRVAGEKDWIVTLTNPTLLKLEPPPPLAQEWANGRDYLVFAKSETEAREKAQRKFSIKPGTVVKSAVPAPPDLYQG